MSAPFFAHLLEAWKLRHHPNMYFAFFEDFKQVFRVLRSDRQKPFNSSHLDRI